ncbi:MULTISPECIES: uridine kinase [Micrococcaceae]|uniref:uridine kinase n=1 Tax=Micrococcaceae TaxID=1268 RepID=UPI00160710FF|nr:MULTISPECIES: uridine kinase [Micrococcaceae]MBB5748778.1 uridine kinase [Micrococcus sp. TA1]HRO29049.1 uridine kinase [Citricoccus sp.]HRO93405.1 uridine kinase [Citricoccus sp.]
MDASATNGTGSIGTGGLVLLGGASGAGKSYLARTYGRPHLQLDAFYREAAEDAAAGGAGPVFPRTEYGQVDWDDPVTWNGRAAVDAMVELLETGRTRVPEYSITASAVIGHATLELAGGPVVAEGIFAAELPRVLTRLGLRPGTDFHAWYIDQHRLPTAARRLARDLAERRKPVPFLVQRGWSLLRTEAALRARYLEAGFTPVPKAELHRRLAAGE